MPPDKRADRHAKPKATKRSTPRRGAVPIMQPLPTEPTLREDVPVMLPKMIEMPDPGVPADKPVHPDGRYSDAQLRKMTRKQLESYPADLRRKRLLDNYVAAVKGLHTAILNLVNPFDFAANSFDHTAIITVAGYLEDGFEEDMKNGWIFEKEYKTRTSSYNDRLAIFFKALLRFFEFTNHDRYKLTENEKIAFIRELRIAIQFLRNTYKAGTKPPPGIPDVR